MIINIVTINIMNYKNKIWQQVVSGKSEPTTYADFAKKKHHDEKVVCEPNSTTQSNQLDVLESNKIELNTLDAMLDQIDQTTNQLLSTSVKIEKKERNARIPKKTIKA